MLDHYSEYPCPPDNECIKQVKELIVEHFSDNNGFYSIPVNDYTLDVIIKETLNDEKPLGSLSGWYVFSQKSVFEKTLSKIKNNNDCKIKND